MNGPRASNIGIVVTDLAFAYPDGEALFFGISFRARAGETVALVGENGVGKSTLLRILIGELQPAGGSYQVPSDVLYLSQWVGVDRHDATLRAFLASVAPMRLRAAALRLVTAEQEPGRSSEAQLALADAIAEWSEVGGYKEEARWDQITRRVLGQGLADAEHRRMSELSGGEAKRIAIEAALLSDAPVLLIDEPDNFLDIPGKLWLEEQLRKTKKCTLLVSHDRTLLTRAVDRIVTIETAGAWVHGGSYATYLEARDRRIAELSDNLDRWKDEERRLYRLYRWMKTRAAMSDKNASYANAAETRWSRFVDAGPPPPPPKRQRVAMRITGDRSGSRVLECRDLELPGLILPFDLDVIAQERIVLLGSNGVGKSHLVRLLAGEALDHSGSIVQGANLRLGYFSQHGLDAVAGGRTALDQLFSIVSNEEAARRILARYGLGGVALSRTDILSGGQRARLQIAMLEAHGTNFLLLDEPTDNLDLDSAEALESMLAEFTGTVIAVTHDRAFMANFGRVLLLDDDGEMLEAPTLDVALEVLTAPTGPRPRNVRTLATM